MRVRRFADLVKQINVLQRQPQNLTLLEAREHPTRHLLRLAWPVSLSMLLHNSYSLIDIFWVSGLGQAPVAAVALFGIAFFVVFSIAQIFATGVHALVARACGAGNLGKAGGIVRDGLVTSFAVGLGLALLTRLDPGWLLLRLGAGPEVVEVGATYVHIMAVGFPLTVSMFTLGNAFRATGDMKTPLVLTTISCVLNVVLDPLLIFGIGPFPELGLAGAAIATIASMLVAFLAAGVLLLRHPVLGSFKLTAPFDPATFRDMFTVGLPSGVQYVFLSVTQSVMIRLVAEFGTPVLAATGIGARITHFTFLPCIGLGAAAATLVGQYLGARREADAERIVAVAFKINLVFNSVVCGAFIFFPGVLFRIFTTEPATLSAGSTYLRIYGVGFLFTTSNIILTRVFQGAGDTLWPTVGAAIRFAIFLLASLFLGWHTGLREAGVWASMALSCALQLAFMGWLYSLGTWKRRALRSVDPLIVPAAEPEMEVD